MYRKDWNKIRNRAILAFLALPVVVALWWIGGVLKHKDLLSFYVTQKDVAGVERYVDTELSSLRDSYSTMRKFGLDWLGNRTIFKDLPVFEGWNYALRGDESSMLSAIGDLEDYRAKRILGSFYFNRARSLYRGGSEGNVFEDQLNRACDYFEEALRLGPDDNFDDRWNYDVCSDEDATQRALNSDSKTTIILTSDDNDLSTEDQRPLIPGNNQDDQVGDLPMQNDGAGKGNTKRIH